MARLAVAAAFGLAVAAATQCTPIYPGCVCQTQNLTCAELDAIATNITNWFYAKYRGVDTAAEMQTDPAGLSREAGETIGAAVRLVFHDAAEFDPGSFASDALRPDGCVHVDAPGNEGIQEAIAMLDSVWRPWCGRMSRSDFWVLAAQTMMQETCPYSNSRRGNNGHVLTAGSSSRRLAEANDPTAQAKPLLAPRQLLKGASRHDHVIFPFKYGRVDRPNCSYPLNASAGGGNPRLPDAEKNAGEIVRSLMTSMGLSVAETVALIGAHTLGAAARNRSGYNNSVWKDRSDLWDITYYKILLTVPFSRRPGMGLRNPRTNASLAGEWENAGHGARNVGSFMLNTDMQLIYDLDPTVAGKFPLSCPAYAVTVDPGNVVLSNASGCPFLRANPMYPDFAR